MLGRRLLKVSACESYESSLLLSLEEAALAVFVCWGDNRLLLVTFYGFV
jgi:hypothetical protein